MYKENNNEKKTTIVLVLILCVIIFLMGLAYNYREELNLRQRAIDIKNHLFIPRSTGIKFEVTASIEGQILKAKFYIPCNSFQEKQKLTKKIFLIKNEMLMSLSVPENIHAIKKRDFTEIKKNCLGVINKYSSGDINKVYLDFFILS